MTIHPLDALVILAYLGLMLILGLALSRRAGSSTQEFFLSGRRLPWFVAGTSMAATTFASDTPLVVTELVRRQGIGGNWIWVNFAISHVVTTFLLARLWRRSGVTTDVELCELRYSGRGAASLRAFKGLFYALVTNVVVLGWVILGMTAIAGIFGVPKLVTLAACIVLASLYASLAGLWGVVLTDLLQLAVALAGAVILAVKVLAAEGGLAGLRLRLPALTDAAGEPAARLAPLAGFDWASPGFRGAFMGFAVAILVQWWSWKYSDGGGVLIQRMNSSRSERDSLLATLWFAVVTYVIRPWPWYLVALVSLWVLPDMADHKAVYPAMMARYLGPGLLGLVLASMLAAFMSTIDTHMNLASSYFVHDVYRRFLRRDADERHYVAAARWSGIGIVLLGSLVAWRSESISDLFTFLLQLVAGAGAVFLLRWFWWRINAWSEISAMLASLLVASLLNLANEGQWFAHRFATWEIFLWNVGLSGAVWLAVAFLAPPTDEANLRGFVARTRPLGLWPARFWPEGRRRPLGASAGRTWANILAGVALIYGLLFGAGQALFGRAPQAVLLLGAALAGGLVLARNLRREPA
ncbi:MAG: Na+:solute symporter [Candidatus Krumholzibacteriota bacterium]|nr:Na+:solute symporter [Candidatus Krumholzibacteriota bacterium]